MRKHTIDEKIFRAGLVKRGWHFEHGFVQVPPIGNSKEQDSKDFHDALVEAVICEEINDEPTKPTEPIKPEPTEPKPNDTIPVRSTT